MTFSSLGLQCPQEQGARLSHLCVPASQTLRAHESLLHRPLGLVMER